MHDTISAVREAVFDAIEVCLAYQLNAVRALRKRERAGEVQMNKSVSQPDLAYDILKKARAPLHISEIIARIQRLHGVKVERESLVSALTKKVARHDRFVRSGKNCFRLMEGA